MSGQAMKNPAIRLKDVASAAGVSETTASMAFTGKGRVSDETKKHILKIASDLGYSYSKRKSTVKNENNHIAVLVLIDREWSSSWLFLSEMISQIDKDLSQMGLNVVLIPISINEADDNIFKKITAIGCKAVLSIHYAKERLFDRLEKINIPVILIMNNNFQDKYFSICIDDFQGAYEGTKHLISLGHARINFVDDVRDQLPILSTDRYFGYRKALDQWRIPFKDEFRCNFIDLDKNAELEAVKSIMTQEEPPTAFFCLDDEIALKLYNALSILGFKIPDDVSIIAPGDLLDYSKPYIPQISTMHIDMTDLGHLAVNMLLNMQFNNLITNQVLNIKPKLTDRGSCRPITT